MAQVFIPINIYKSLNNNAQVLEFDAEGNPIFYAEASNPNPDITNEKMFPETLMESAEYFKIFGNITLNHIPTRNPETGLIGFIGKPLEVFTRGNSVFVKFKLNKQNPLVKDLLNKLKAGQEFFAGLRASIGGKLAERVKTSIQKENGTKVLAGKFLWNELALTFEPVNDTLKDISITKSLQKQIDYISPNQLTKSLQATGLTDLSNATGADALALPSLAHFKQLIRDGTLKNRKQIIEYLQAQGFTPEQIRKVFKEKKMSLKDKIEEISKSLHKKRRNDMDQNHTPEKLAEKYAGYDPDIKKAFLEELKKMAKNASPEELEEMAKTLAKNSGLMEDGDEELEDEELEDEEVAKSLADDEWQEHIHSVGKELGIDSIIEVQKSLQRENEELRNKLSQTLSVLEDMAETVEKSLKRKSATEEAKNYFAQRQSQGQSQAEDFDDMTLVEKSLEKHISADQDKKLRKGSNDADNILAGMSLSVRSGKGLKPDQRRELEIYLNQN